MKFVRLLFFACVWIIPVVATPSVLDQPEAPLVGAAVSSAQADPGCSGNFVFVPFIPVPLPAAGGTYGVQFTIGAGCPWAVSSISPEVQIPAPGSGMGDGSTSITFAQNLGAPRELNLTIKLSDVVFPYNIPQLGAAAVPEPSSIALVGVGLAVSYSRRRMSRSRTA